MNCRLVIVKLKYLCNNCMDGSRFSSSSQECCPTVVRKRCIGMELCQYIDLCFHASSLPCLHTFWHAIPTSFYVFNVFYFLVIYVIIASFYIFYASSVALTILLLKKPSIEADYTPRCNLKDRHNVILLLNFIVHTTIGVKRSYKNKG